MPEAPKPEAEATPEAVCEAGFQPRRLLAFMRWMADNKAELEKLGEGTQIDKLKALRLAFYAGADWEEK